MKAKACAAPALLLVAFSGCSSGGSGSGSLVGTGSYTIGGFVNNLSNSPIKLLDNGGDATTVTNFGSFTFHTPLSYGATYNVTIASQPANGQTCAMQNGSGVVNGQVTSILVNCYFPISVGGAVYGLIGSGLELQNNGSDTLSIQSNGPFQFSSTINFGQTYDVTVLAQPTAPAQRCTVTNATGAPQQSTNGILVSCGSAAAHWIWQGGSQSTAKAGIYGQQGVPSPNNNPGARGGGMSWTDPAGNFWLFGGQDYIGLADLNDLWKYSNGQWTWVSGSNDPTQSHAGIYGTMGVPDPANVPGSREDGTAWTDSSGNLWLYGGGGQLNTSGAIVFGDLWRFSSGEWTWVSGSNQTNQSAVYGSQGVAAPGNNPGARFGAAGWIDSSNTLWLFGGHNITIFPDGGSTRDQNDLWKFSNGQWTWVSGGNDPLANPPGVYGTLGVPDPANTPGARTDASTWTDASGALWLFGGQGWDSAGNYGALNDLWCYKNGEWTWMSGSNLAGSLGHFGIMGVPDPANVPPARAGALTWIDVGGNLWLFGGGGYDQAGGDGQLNDLWEFSHGVWTYVSGSELSRQASNYGPLGVASAESLPGGCSGNMQWIDKSCRLWAYCLNINDQEGQILSANDLWTYQP